MPWGEPTTSMVPWVRIDRLEAENKILRDRLAEVRDELEGERHLRDQAEAVVEAAANVLGEANRLSLVLAKAEGELARWRDLANLRLGKLDDARDLLETFARHCKAVLEVLS